MKFISFYPSNFQLDLQNTALKESYLLANVILVFHILIVMFEIIAPFFDSPLILMLHITLSMCLLIHWITNNNECSLTWLESKYRGVSKPQTLSYRFINPLYDVQEFELAIFMYIAAIGLTCMSIYQLYNSQKLATFLKNPSLRNLVYLWQKNEKVKGPSMLND